MRTNQTRRVLALELGGHELTAAGLRNIRPRRLANVDRTVGQPRQNAQTINEVRAALVDDNGRVGRQRPDSESRYG